MCQENQAMQYRINFYSHNFFRWFDHPLFSHLGRKEMVMSSRRCFCKRENKQGRGGKNKIEKENLGLLISKS